MTLDGATRLYLIVGDPIAQVKSPAGMTAALQAAGRNAVMMPAHVTPDDLAAFLAGAARARNLDGIIATIPHKFACYGHCATATPRAHVLRAVNVMRRNPDGTWHGDMLDGLGFAEAARWAGWDGRGRALLVGAGGAGSAIGLALLDAGAAYLAVHDIDPVRRDALIARLAPHHPGRVGFGTADPRGCALVAHASPAGMRAGDPPPLDFAALDPAMLVGCAITVPTIPPLIEAARARGCRSFTGTDMFAQVQPLMMEFLLQAG